MTVFAIAPPNTASTSTTNAMMQAEQALRTEHPGQAITMLSRIHEPQTLSSEGYLDYSMLLAQAYERSGQFVYAIQTRQKIDSLLSDKLSLQKNRRQLWLSFMLLKSSELYTLKMESEKDPLLQGWLTLAQIARQKLGAHALFERLQEWRRLYPEHPANTLLPRALEKVLPYLYPAPKQVALLLPLSGALAGPAEAIRAGFEAAARTGSAHNILTIKIYDTTKGEIRALYQEAIHAGADYIVGPLTKPDVAAIANTEHPVPTLFLNDIDVPAHDYNAFRFGLLPLNEARQVAVKAAKNGYHRALVIAPHDAWGEAIVHAFQDEYQKQAGTVVDSLSYEENTDLNTAVGALLHVTKAQALQKQYHANAKGHRASIPPRRDDFDVIFLLAYPSRARQIMPLLKYYFAGNVPVYATSSVYAGNTNTMRDRDLSGLLFCDIPWMLKHAGTPKNWPEQLNSYDRLYALGVDSFALSMQLNQLMIFPGVSLNDDSGVLYLNRYGQIARVLAWGRFENGVATLVSEAG